MFDYQKIGEKNVRKKNRGEKQKEIKNKEK